MGKAPLAGGALHPPLNMSHTSPQAGPAAAPDVSPPSAAATPGRGGAHGDGSHDTPPHDHGGHSHGIHGHGHPPPKGRALVWAIFFSGALLIVEVVGGLWSGSLALLSDAGHMASDISALVLAWLAMRFAARPADLRRTFGFHRLEILAALVNGAALLAVGAGIAWEAAARLDTRVTPQTGVMIGVAAAGLAANLASLFFLARERGGGLNLRGAFLHVLSDTLSSIGVVIAGLLIAWTGWAWIDPAVSLVIVLLIAVSALRLLRDAVDVLLEAAPRHLDLEAMRAAIVGVRGVEAVHDLHVWSITSGMDALSMHVVRGSEVQDGDLLLASLNAVLREEFGITHTTIQIETRAYPHPDQICCDPAPVAR